MIDEYEDLCEGDFKCPHCGVIGGGTWFDRSIAYGFEDDSRGIDELEHECFATRCNECGKNVDAPREYYREEAVNND